MNKCYLALGSNQKHPTRQIWQALKAIKTLPATHMIKYSKMYWSKAWGVANQQDFCNAVVEINTRLDPWVLLTCCQSIEKQQGRVRKKRWGPRVIDIDIIIFNNRKINSRRLKIPHPHFKNRDFVLKPLLEINHNFQV